MTPTSYFEDALPSPAITGESLQSLVNGPHGASDQGLRALPPQRPHATKMVLDMPERFKNVDSVLFAPRIAMDKKVTSPFEVKIITQPDSVVAVIEQIDEFGIGTSLGDALDDLRLTLAELYGALLDRRAALSPDLTRVLDFLLEHFAPDASSRAE